MLPRTSLRNIENATVENLALIVEQLSNRLTELEEQAAKKGEEKPIDLDHLNVKSITIADDGFIRTKTFVGGMAGSGIQLAYDKRKGVWQLTTDDVRVRGNMAVHKFTVQEVRASNGDLFVTSSGKVRFRTRGA